MPPLTCLDCSRCHATFSAEPGLPTSPVFSSGELSCSTCAPNDQNVESRSATFIIEMLLGQPVTHTENGWQPDGPLTPWACKICESAYMEEGEQKAMLYGCCQQLTCTDCYYSQRFRHEDDCQGVPIIQKDGDYQQVIEAYQEAVRSQAMEEEDYECADEGLDGPLLAPPDEAGNLSEGVGGASNAKKRRLTMAEVVKQCQNASWPTFWPAEPIQIEAKPVPKAIDVPYALEDRPEAQLNPDDLKATCENCKRTYDIHDVFLCLKCDESTLCGICCFKDHKAHECVELKERKLANLEKTTSEFLSQHYAGLHGNIRGIHAEIDDVQKALVKACEESLKLVPGQTDYCIGARLCAELKATAEDFEKCFEAYLPHARMYGTNLQNLKEKVQEFVAKCVASE